MSIEISKQARRQRSIAETFKHDAVMERLLAAKAAAEAGNVVAARLVEGLSPGERMSFGSYQLARDAAIAERLVDDDGQPR